MDRDIELAEGPKRHFRTIAMIVGTAMFMEQLDGTVLATGLPTMARDLGVTPANMSIALTSYLVSLAIFIPASGKIADKWGARKIFRVAIGVFTLGSILCAQSQSLWFLVAARFLEGMGGAMMLPVGRLLLFRSIEKHQMMSAMSWLLIPALLGPILGPVLGGFIITTLNWRWIFYINLPIGLAGMGLVTVFVAEVAGDPATRFDLKGICLSAASLAALLFGFELTSHPGELDVALLLLAAGAITGIVYLTYARHARDPILDFRLLTVPTFGTSVIAGSLTVSHKERNPFSCP